MAIVEFRGGPVNMRYLMNKKRSDLEFDLRQLASDKRLNREAVARAIMTLVERLPE